MDKINLNHRFIYQILKYKIIKYIILHFTIQYNILYYNLIFENIQDYLIIYGKNI